jgi:CrcB protein
VITYLWIAIGGALGSVARYASTNMVAGWLGAHFPWGTLAINILGSFVIGFFAALTGPGGRFHLLVSNDARLFVMIGICGGYTTFSSFSLQTLDLIQAGAWLRAGLNVVASVLLCLIAVFIGYLAAVAINAGKVA